MLDHPPQAQPRAPREFRPGGGDIAQHISDLDASRTALGPQREWPEPLRLAVRVMLASREPMCLWWGEERVNLHNEACAALLGAGHLAALGVPAAEAWAHLWPRLGATAEAALHRGEGFMTEPLAMPIERGDAAAEAHIAVSASPLAVDEGFAGLLCTFSDRTAAVVAERRLDLLHGLAVRARGIHSVEAACVRAIEGLGADPFDIPFAGIYLVEPDRSGASLTAAIGIPAGHGAMPSRLAIDEPHPYPIRRALDSGELVAVRLDDARLQPLPPGAWMRPLREAIVTSLGPVGNGREAVLVAAMNPLHPLDDAHRRFLELVAAQVSATLANAHATESERRERIERGLRRDEAELAATKDQLASQVVSLTMLHGLAVKLGTMTDMASAMQAILETAVDAQDGQSGIIWLQDPETGDLVAEASRGFEGENLLRFQRVPAGPEGGSAGNAFHRRQRWVVYDTESDEPFAPYRAAARAVGFRAVHSTPIVTRSGALLGVLSVHFAQCRTPSQRDQQVADVCARHAAEAIEALRSQEALRESERLYRAIGESIDYGVWVCDAHGRNTYASDSFLKLVGMTQEQCSGFGWAAVMHPDDLQRTLSAWKKCVAEGGLWDMEQRVKGVDGRWHSVLARGVPVKNARGAIVAWAGINLDIARLKQVEDELRELDQRKNEFLATLAHELRNPLAPLRNGLEVMRLASNSPQTVEKARGMMQRQLTQMVRLVDDLLDVSRVSRGKIELRRERVELASVLRNALETSEPIMAERRHAFEVDIPARRILVDADVTRLSQVFWNLLNNAAKYTETGGRVRLSVQPLDGEVEVSVRDNGIGIPPDMQARVFDIFTQVDRTLEKAQGGLGIGLSIAKRLVEMHGGTITVKSEGHGTGCQFVVRLPATVEREASRIGSETGQHAALGGPRHRVLVVDDNPDSATTLSLMLEVIGNDVRVAHDGEEAIEMAARFRPDAILLDIGMPKMNGFDACRRIRETEAGRQAFIVALTGWSQEQDRKRSAAAGFDRHLVKPVEPATLEKLIRGLPVRAPPPRK